MTADQATVQGYIVEETAALAELLLEKNRLYGNAALEPLGVFGPSDPAAGIRVRLDDKLKRIQTLQPDDQEDVVLDLLGYLILLRVAERLEKIGRD